MRCIACRCSFIFDFLLRAKYSLCLSRTRRCSEWILWRRSYDFIRGSAQRKTLHCLKSVWCFVENWKSLRVWESQKEAEWRMREFLRWSWLWECFQKVNCDNFTVTRMLIIITKSGKGRKIFSNLLRIGSTSQTCQFDQEGINYGLKCKIKVEIWK